MRSYKLIKLSASYGLPIQTINHRWKCLYFNPSFASADNHELQPNQLQKIYSNLYHLSVGKMGHKWISVLVLVSHFKLYFVLQHRNQKIVLGIFRSTEVFENKKNYCVSSSLEKRKISIKNRERHNSLLV